MTAKCEFIPLNPVVCFYTCWLSSNFHWKIREISHDCSFTAFLFRIRTWQINDLSSGVKKNMGPQQCRRDWAVKTFQRCQNNPPRKLRGYKGCHSKRWGSCRSSQLALLLIPHLTIHSQVHTSKDVTNTDAFSSAHTPLETPGRCLLHPRTSRRQPAAHTALSVNHSSAWHTAAQSSVIHLHLRPLAWDEWGGDRSVTLLGPRVWALLGSIRLPQSLTCLFRL